MLRLFSTTVFIVIAKILTIFEFPSNSSKYLNDGRFYFLIYRYHLHGNGVNGYTMLTMKMLAARMMRFISRPMRIKSLKR